jgi:hypothetical protein
MKGVKGFQKGESGNPEGRKTGVKNKIDFDLKKSIIDFLESRFSEVVTAWNKMNAKDKLAFYKDLLQYVVPKLQAGKTELTTHNEPIGEIVIKTVSKTDKLTDLAGECEHTTKEIEQN